MSTIPPIQKIALPGIEDLLGKTAQVSDASVQVPFQSLFQAAVGDVMQTGAAKDGEVEKIVTGQTDNLHDAVIASQKFSLSVDLLVQLRNKALDAYKEIMQIGV